jgi:hypothetical protein
MDGYQKHDFGFGQSLDKVCFLPENKAESFSDNYSEYLKNLADDKRFERLTFGSGDQN